MSYERASFLNQTQEVKPDFKGCNFKFPEEEQEKIQERLKTYIPREDISKRTAHGGSSVSYIEGWKSIRIANEIFGFNGWSTSIVNINVDFLDIVDGKFSVGVNCVVRVILKDGSFHEDIGYGMMENSKSKGAAFEKARKEAVTDAVKRALRYFGNCLGNCLYDKEYLKAVSKAPTRSSPSFGINNCSIKPNGFATSSFYVPTPLSTDASTNLNPMRLSSSNMVVSNPPASSSSHGIYPVKNEVLTPALSNFGQTAQPGGSSEDHAQISASNNLNRGKSDVDAISTGQPNLREDSLDFDFIDTSFGQIDEDEIAALSNKVVCNEQTNAYKGSHNEALTNITLSSTNACSSKQMSKTSFCDNDGMGGISMSTSFVSAASLRKVASPLVSRSKRTLTDPKTGTGNQTLGDHPDLKRHCGF